MKSGFDYFAKTILHVYSLNNIFHKKSKDALFCRLNISFIHELM